MPYPCGRHPEERARPVAVHDAHEAGHLTERGVRGPLLFDKGVVQVENDRGVRQATNDMGDPAHRVSGTPHAAA